jgi:hypothetical protein
MCDEFKHVHVNNNKKQGPGAPSISEVAMIPVFAGIVLCCLYFSIKRFGKESVNKAMLLYFALSMSN